MQLSHKFVSAMNYAVLMHLNQERKGSGTPYVSHLLGVASLVLEHDGSENEAIAALLHDAVEDQGGKETLKRITELFGQEIADIVDGCSDTDVMPKPPWRVRKETYLLHLRNASQSVLLVSACDKLYNAWSIHKDLREIGDEVWTRFKGGKIDSLWYYRALIVEYRKTGNHPVYDELEKTVRELHKEAGIDYDQP